MGRRKRNSPSQFMTNYLVSRDGKTLGIFEGYSEQQAIDRAQQYHGSGRYVAIKDPVKLSAWTFAKRENNALENFVENVQEQFGLTRQEAIDALQAYIRLKAVKLDRRMGRYQLTAGDYWEKPVLLRAVQLQREYMAKQTSKRKQNKTLIKADRIEHLDVARAHNPRYLVSRDGEEVGIFPGYNALMAVNAARKIYGPGKYTSTKTGEAMYLGRGALETERREREERTARAAAKAAAKRDKIQLPKKSRTRRNAAGKADILQQGVKAGLLPAGLVTDLKRLEEGRYSDDPKRRENLMSRAIILRSQLIYRNMIEKDPLNEAAQRALESIIVKEVQWQKQHKQNPRTRRNAEGWRNEYDGAFSSIIFGTRHQKVIDLGRRKRGAERDLVMAYADDLLQLTMKNVAALDDGGLLAELSSKARTSAKRKHKVDPTRAALLLDQAEEIMLGGRRNPAEKDAEHPIEVTRHFRGGPPGYLSPWQKAMAIGQAELFDTGIKLAPRAAELRAARLSNPGATKPVYQSGLKQATAAQLGRLARVGLRVGRTPTEIRSDLAATGRFTAEQIRRGLDQATTAEKRQNPFSLDLAKDGEEYDGPAFDFYVIFMHDPDGPYKNWMMFRLNEAARIRENMLSLQRSGAMPPGPQRFHIYDMRGGSTYMTDYVITIDPLTYQAPIDPETYFANPRGRSRRNPPVREIYQTFNGRPATRENSVNAPRGTPARVAQLGRLRLIRTRDGRSWKFPGDRAPFLAADSRGKLHVVGGAYRANPAGESCGEIEQIEYQTSKPHLGHENETIYYHQLGEETGVMPELEITPEGHLKIVGGDYRIEADGIHN